INNLLFCTGIMESIKERRLKTKHFTRNNLQIYTGARKNKKMNNHARNKAGRPADGLPSG
ncbi:hypothetical protein, partial [Klebsiella quasipneumoniae]|uniref:hypothetical protein n=1 Tax=Klebsiella quasipneumoniae TaxID=1463165 RepID=UPI001CFF0585